MSRAYSEEPTAVANTVIMSETVRMTLRARSWTLQCYSVVMPHKTKLTTINLSVSVQLIERRIYLIRSQKVMIDFDLAELDGVSTSGLNEQVTRNRKRFPKDFMFRLTKEEAGSLRSQFAISNMGRGGRRYLPYAFTGRVCQCSRVF